MDMPPFIVVLQSKISTANSVWERTRFEGWKLKVANLQSRTELTAHRQEIS